MNEELIFNQFRMWRGWTIGGLKKVPAEVVKITPDGFSNNIHWNAGHVLVGWDHGIFPPLKLERRLPLEYHLSFPRGTSPKTWENEPPAFEDVLTRLEEQAEELIEACRGKLDTPLPEPFRNLTTVGELFLFLVSHESLHMGVVKGINYALSK